MTEQNQIKALAELAELDGWTKEGPAIWVNADKSKKFWCFYSGDKTLWSADCPNWLESYDAIIPLIQKLETWQEVCIEAENHFSISFSLRLSPAQLCEALLRATNKWTDDLTGKDL